VTLVVHFYLSVAIFIGHLTNYSYGTELHEPVRNRNVLFCRAILHHCRAMQICSTGRKTQVAVLCNEQCNVDLDLWIYCLELRPKLLLINSNYKTDNRGKWCQKVKYSPSLRHTNRLLRILHLILQL
jgi:hypothetical protein